MNVLEKAEELRVRLPAGGLFAGKSWLAAPEPLPLGKKLWDELEALGKVFKKFYEVCDRMYLRSSGDGADGVIARVLDAGKPERLLAHARAKGVRGKLPRVMRPDVLLTEEGLRVTELDSVPGGIGLAAWLQECHAELNPGVVTGAGVLEAWRGCFAERDVIVSQEAATYRPEMEWLAQRTPGQEVLDAESYVPRGRGVYRFVECFDLGNMAQAEEWMRTAESGMDFSPPLRPHLEEKLWAAFLWLQPLEEVWRRELGEGYLRMMRGITPYSWMVTPERLPVHAVLPELGVNDWGDVAKFSQKARELVLKRSGFSEDAWGSRSVVVGHDVSREDWESSLNRALEDWGHSPFVLQKFATSKVLDVDFVDAGGALTSMRARLRLCPYYFVMPDGEVLMTAVKVTAVPADKKVIHGIEDCVIALGCP